MQYTIIANGRSYDIPKRTMQIAEKIEEVIKTDNMPNLPVREKFKSVHEFLKEVLGNENTEEILGSGNLEEVDLSEVTLTFRKIVDAYGKPVADFDASKVKNSLNDMPIDKIISLANTVHKMGAGK